MPIAPRLDTSDHDPIPLAQLPTRVEDDIAQYIAD